MVCYLRYGERGGVRCIGCGEGVGYVRGRAFVWVNGCGRDSHEVGVGVRFVCGQGGSLDVLCPCCVYLGVLRVGIFG